MNGRITIHRITEPFKIEERTYAIIGADPLHTAWAPLGLSSRSLYQLDDETYLAISRTPMLHGPGRAAVAVISRLEVLSAAIETGASDDVLTTLGVTLDEGPRPNRPFQKSHKNTKLLAVTHPHHFWYNCIYLNFDGGLINNRVISLEPLPLYQDWSRRLTQREAIIFALRHRRTEDALGGTRRQISPAGIRNPGPRDPHRPVAHWSNSDRRRWTERPPRQL